MIDGSNGLTSWLLVLVKNKLTMFGAHCPFIPLDQLAESKVIISWVNELCLVKNKKYIIILYKELF